LMEPTDEKGLIANFINKHGEGLHHIGFAVSNIEELIESMKISGCKIINEKPEEIKGLKAVFIHPKSFSGVLFEFIEYPKDWAGWQNNNK
jgi:methylmalonyl-CoA/ethylmalonyl-CoA epimerase